MKGLANMKKLRFLHVISNRNHPNFLRFLRVLLGKEVSNWNLPKSLRFLRCYHYPFSSLPKTFQPINLVGLQMRYSEMDQLWKDGEEKPFPNLRFLKFCSSLTLRSLDLSVAPNLETLILERCWSLETLHMPAECPKLITLNLEYLEKLRTLHLGVTPKLVNLVLNRNVKLRTLDLGVMPNLESLDLFECYGLKEINAPAECLKKLLHLNLSKCARFKSFKFDKKHDSTEVVSLSELHLIAADAYDTDDAGICNPGNTWPEFKYSCYYKEDPASSFGNLERLISLGFGARINADSFSDIICGLQCLRKLILEGGIPEAPKNLDRLDCLEELLLKSTDIKTLPDSICMLKHLKSLELESCLLLEKLPVDIGRLERLESLILSNCKLLKDLPNSICMLKHLKSLKLESCLLLEKLPVDIGRLECLESLILSNCTLLKDLPNSICLLKHLISLVLVSCLLLEKLPVDIGRLECLESLILYECTLVQDLPNSICEMKRLKWFQLTHCIQVENLPEEIGRLESLKELDILGSGISYLPHSLYGLRGLRIIGDRWLLESCGLTPKRRRMSDEDSDFDDEMYDEDSDFDDEMVCDI